MPAMHMASYRYRTSRFPPLKEATILSQFMEVMRNPTLADRILPWLFVRRLRTSTAIDNEGSRESGDQQEDLASTARCVSAYTANSLKLCIEVGFVAETNDSGTGAEKNAGYSWRMPQHLVAPEY